MTSWSRNRVVAHSLNLHFLSASQGLLFSFVRQKWKKGEILHSGLHFLMVFLHTTSQRENNIYRTCSQYASRHGWWITQHGPEKKEKKNQDECCKYKHLVFHGVDAKPAGFMITQQSTILSPVWQQVMQMCAAQQCSAALSAPFKSVQQAGHTGSLLWMKCWDAFLQDALSLITHLAGL